MVKRNKGIGMEKKEQKEPKMEHKKCECVKFGRGVGVQYGTTTPGSPPCPSLSTLSQNKSQSHGLVCISMFAVHTLSAPNTKHGQDSRETLRAGREPWRKREKTTTIQQQ
jgi:hypothetical protein